METPKAKVLLTGVAASQGIARGKVKIVSGIQDAPSFEEGSILVTHITDPTMVMMMAMASAIICDIGGIASHPAIVSREMGIPCIVNTTNGTKVLQDGQGVVVDGTRGEVYAAE
jgi:phosphoenolpyruvate synthase/pyruvate phosphate dikinase